MRKWAPKDGDTIITIPARGGQRTIRSEDVVP